MDDERTTIVIPTELDRSDAAVVLCIASSVLLGCLWALLQGHHPTVPLVLVVMTLLWTLTSRPATEVRFVGFFASALRNKIGERDIHEWLFAYQHYIRLVYVPIWRSTCVRFYKSIHQHLSNLHHWLSARMRWLRLPIGSWGYRIASRLLARRAK